MHWLALRLRSALQSLIKARDGAARNLYVAKGLTHTWASYYTARVASSQACVNEWHAMDDIESHRSADLDLANE